MKRIIKKVAFTLAEVLITLGIIGVVAAITIPMLIQQYKEKLIVNRLANEYSKLSQAFTIIANDEGEHVFEPSTEGITILAKYIPKYLKVDIVQPPSKISSEQYYTYLNGSYDNWMVPYSNIQNNGWFEMSDGTLFSIFQNGGILYLQMYPLGKGKSKMTFGIDIFRFFITKNGTIMPSGDKNNSPNYNWTTSFAQSCIPYGVSCAAWVLYNKNLDYLHCPDQIGWNKAKSCKN